MQVSGRQALHSVHAAMAAESRVHAACREEEHEIAGNQQLSATIRSQRIAKVRKIRNRASQALLDLEDDERQIVQGGEYLRDAVDGLTVAADRLNRAVADGHALADRLSQISGLITGVATAGDQVVDALVT